MTNPLPPPSAVDECERTVHSIGHDKWHNAHQYQGQKAIRDAFAKLRAACTPSEPVVWHVSGPSRAWYTDEFDSIEREIRRACTEEGDDADEYTVTPLYASPARAGWQPPEGFVLVPVEPTEAMLRRACELQCPDNIGPDYKHAPALVSALRKVYLSMLAAAAPAAAGTEGEK